MADAGANRVIKISIKNNLRPPEIDATVEMDWMGESTYTIEYLEKACREHIFDFKGKTYPDLGVFITEMNGVAAAEGEYWSFIDAETGKLYPVEFMTEVCPDQKCQTPTATVTMEGTNYIPGPIHGSGPFFGIDGFIDIGVSSHIPKPGEHIVFKLAACPPRGECTS